LGVFKNLKKHIMKKLFIALMTTLSVATFAQDKLTTTSGHIKFFSTTPAENIESNNYKVVSAITPSEGKVVFSVPMQSFEFEKSLMQKHFNSDKFLDTKQFPNAKFKGSITNLSKVDFFNKGSYVATVKGQLTIHGVTKPIEQEMKLNVDGTKITGFSNFDITLADYGITFSGGKPSTNIAKTVNVTVNLEFNNNLTASK
jgi:polyisoprenoid-binding protein YceI